MTMPGMDRPAWTQPHDLERELADADRRIAGAKERLARQSALVAHLVEQGRDTSLADMLRKEIQRGLDLMLHHRNMIIREMSPPVVAPV